MLRLISAGLLGATVLLAQGDVRPDLSTFVYPAIAKAARIQGTVRFAASGGEVHLVSGHPLLIATAQKNLESWASMLPAGRRFSVNYIFSLTAEHEGVREQPIGDAFDRFFLRIFHRPTKREVRECVDDPSENHTVRILDDETIEITMQATPRCPAVMYSLASAALP